MSPTFSSHPQTASWATLHQVTVTKCLAEDHWSSQWSWGYRCSDFDANYNLCLYQASNSTSHSQEVGSPRTHIETGCCWHYCWITGGLSQFNALPQQEKRMNLESDLHWSCTSNTGSLIDGGGDGKLFCNYSGITFQKLPSLSISILTLSPIRMTEWVCHMRGRPASSSTGLKRNPQGTMTSLSEGVMEKDPHTLFWWLPASFVTILLLCTFPLQLIYLSKDFQAI